MGVAVMSGKVNIIGAGLAGLSAGIYLQKAGISTEIFELAPWAGGMCTAWERDGYKFDGCIHWMVGTKTGDPIYKLYRETGALETTTKIYNAPSVQMEMDGAMYEIPLEYEKFRAYLLKEARGDEDKIEAILKDIKVMAQCELPMGAPSNLPEVLHMILKSRGFLMLAKNYAGKTVEEYLSGLKSEKVRQILFRLMPPHFSAVALIMMLGTRMSGNAGYPMGGASEVTQRMVDKYKALGGKLRLSTKVDEIVVEKDAVKGVRAKGSFYPSDYVIAACDANDTLKNMLGSKYPHPQLDALLKDAELFEPLALVSFGLDKRFDLPYSVSYEYPEGIATSPATKSHAIQLRSFEFDQSSAPDGGSSVMIMMEAPLDYWANLRKTDLNEYKKQKQLLADAVADAVEKRIPGFTAAIRITDVSTPATYAHLTNVYKASYEGFAPIPALISKTIKKTIPGLARLYLCGQWTTIGGGICAAVADGKTAAQKIAKELR
jgi:phytoene dehydrogenase-like protein